MPASFNLSLTAITVAACLALVVLERLRPARAFPPVRGWTLIAGVFLAASMPVIALTSVILPVQWLSGHALVRLPEMPLAVEVVVGYVASTFLGYWLHRAQHQFDWFWRSGHQLHHAIARVDIAATTVLHPTDLFLQIATNIIACALVLGLSPDATGIVSLIATLCGFVQHLNVRTPTWLALIVQRPEAHCLHHQISVHAYNYSDFPLWDRLFGTFRNPHDWAGIAGFGVVRPRLGDLLMMRNVSAGARDTIALA